MGRLCKARIGMYNYDIYTNNDGGSGRGIQCLQMEDAPR